MDCVSRCPWAHRPLARRCLLSVSVAQTFCPRTSLLPKIVSKLHNDIDAIDVRCFEACQSMIKKHVGINMLVSSFFSFQFLANVRPKPATPIRVMVAFGVGSVVAFVTGQITIEDVRCCKLPCASCVLFVVLECVYTR